MSSGFPNRPARSEFGPSMQDVRPVTQPDKELGAAPVNLTFWQLAGAGRTVAMAVLLYNGTTPELLSRALAFDSNEVLPTNAVTSVRNATGDYSFTFQSSYPDESGRQVPFVPKMALAMVQGASPNIQGIATVSAQTVNVLVKDNAGVAANATVLVMVW